jgi:hypothetical protein
LKGSKCCTTKAKAKVCVEPQLENLGAVSTIGFGQYAMKDALARMWCDDVVLNSAGESREELQTSETSRSDRQQSPPKQHQGSKELCFHHL